MAEAGETTKPPVSFRIGRQLDQEKIDVLTKRVDVSMSINKWAAFELLCLIIYCIQELVASNTLLRSNADRNGKDTHDIVLYFQVSLLHYSFHILANG